MRSRVYALALCLFLACYACGRVLQVLHGPPATLPLVAAEVLAAFAVALVDGARSVGVRGILIFTLICALVGNGMENLGVATGFPYGHYTFLGVMGPKLFAVPVLLGLAYIGMAWASWRLGCAIAGPRARWFVPPVVAAFVMTAWDLAQDPVWSTMLHAWAWRDGGRWFGVPLSNYFGWLVTTFLIFAMFAAYQRRRAQHRYTSAWPALALYSLCAAGNILQLLTRHYAPDSFDASGVPWRTRDILAASAIVSLLVMGGLTAVAARRTRAKG